MLTDRTRKALAATSAALLFLAAMAVTSLFLAGCSGTNDREEGGGDPRVTYVSVGGDDEDSGASPEAAYRTIGMALEEVRPGDTIHVLPGVYHEALMVEDVGRADRPITIRGDGGPAVLDGQRTLDIGFWCEGCAGFVVENLEIRNYTDVGVGVCSSSDVVMRNLVVHDDGFAVQSTDWELEGYGIDADDSRGITIEDNDVYANGPQPRPWGVLGTGINTYMCVNCVIRNNHSHENVGGGILVEDGENVLVEGNTVVANYLDATEDEWWDGGIWVDGGHGVTVVNNVFRDNLGPGIQISDEDDQDPYGYVLEGNVSSGNYTGIYIWNFGSADWPPEDILSMSGNQISGNSVQDVWIEP